MKVDTKINTNSIPKKIKKNVKRKSRKDTNNTSRPSTVESQSSTPEQEEKPKEKVDIPCIQLSPRSENKERKRRCRLLIQTHGQIASTKLINRKIKRKKKRKKLIKLKALHRSTGRMSTSNINSSSYSKIRLKARSDFRSATKRNVASSQSISNFPSLSDTVFHLKRELTLKKPIQTMNMSWSAPRMSTSKDKRTVNIIGISNSYGNYGSNNHNHGQHSGGMKRIQKLQPISRTSSRVVSRAVSRAESRRTGRNAVSLPTL